VVICTHIPGPCYMVCSGLRTALVERSDWAAGTSSRSTKLVHGGVRYLEKAVMGFDLAQLNLVYEALHERATLLANAPHLARPLAIVTVRPYECVCACVRACVRVCAMYVLRGSQPAARSAAPHAEEARRVCQCVYMRFCARGKRCIPG
jgi:glycerol-3-phosphate dehydrogenase